MSVAFSIRPMERHGIHVAEDRSAFQRGRRWYTATVRVDSQGLHHDNPVWMPFWWNSSRMDIWRIRKADGRYTYLLNSLPVTAGAHSDAERVTADLYTGKEIVLE